MLIQTRDAEVKFLVIGQIPDAVQDHDIILLDALALILVCGIYLPGRAGFIADGDTVHDPLGFLRRQLDIEKHVTVLGGAGGGRLQGPDVQIGVLEKVFDAVLLVRRHDLAAVFSVTSFHEFCFRALVKQVELSDRRLLNIDRIADNRDHRREQDQPAEIFFDLALGDFLVCGRRRIGVDLGQDLLLGLEQEVVISLRRFHLLIQQPLGLFFHLLDRPKIFLLQLDVQDGLFIILIDAA